MPLPPGLKAPVSEYVVAAALGFLPAVIFFLAILAFVVSDTPPGQPAPNNTAADRLALFTLLLTALVWLASSLLIVYTRIPLTYTTKTYKFVVSVEPYLVLVMPAFALATFPIDILDAVIAHRRRKRGVRSPGEAAAPSRDRSSD